MSILIEDIEMPTETPVLFCIHPNGKVFADLEGGWREYKAVPVPSHGRLIDADALMKRISHMNMEAYMDGACYGIHPSLEYLDLLNEILDDAPTIIPADPAEEE